MSKQFKIAISVSSILIVLLLIIGGCLWYGQAKMYVKMGFAQDKFPYKMYTVEELSTMYSQEPLEGVKTTQTPEQTHTKFIEALKKGDIDGAVECCVLKNNQEIIKKEIERIKEKGMFDKMLNDIENINSTDDIKDESTRIFTYFIEANGKKWGQSFIFQKNLQGVWLIESF